MDSPKNENSLGSLWWDVSIYHIGVDFGMISLRRRSEKDIKAVNIRQTELMRMFLLLQRAIRKEFLEGT
jgi:hypothetical protein